MFRKLCRLADPQSSVWQHIKAADFSDFSDISDLAAACDDLGMIEREFMRQASYRFDMIKPEFNEVDLSGYSVTITGSQAAAKADRSITIPISRVLVLEWHKVWVTKAGQLLKEHLNHIKAFVKQQDLHLDIACVVLTGGGAKSDILREALGQILGEDITNVKIRHISSDLRCAKGALMYHVFQEDSLPLISNFFIVQQQYYNRSKHRTTAKETSPWDPNEEIVHDRLKCIMEYNNGRFYSKGMFPLVFRVEVGILGRLYVDLWWSEQHIRDSSPLYDDKDNIRDGIRKYPVVFADIPNLANHGYLPKGDAATGKQYFEVRTWVEMVGTEHKLDLIVHVMTSNYGFPTRGCTYASATASKNPAQRL